MTDLELIAEAQTFDRRMAGRDPREFLPTPRLPRWFRFVEAVQDAGCKGGECDLGAPCWRHHRISEIAHRWDRMRSRRTP